MSFHHVIKTYLREHVHRNLRSPQTAEQIIYDHILPLANIRQEHGKPIGCCELSRSRVKEWYYEKVKYSVSVANRALSILHHMLNFAKDEMGEYEHENVTSRIKRIKEEPRSRYMKHHEIVPFRQGLEKVKLVYQVFFWTCLLCASRRRETLLMQWNDLDLEQGLWEKPAWTTKTRRPHVVPLSNFLVDQLKRLPRLNDYVFASHHPDCSNRPISTARVEQVWRQVRRGWGDGKNSLTLHDLRRTTATWMAMAGENLTCIQNTLGHVDLSQTHKYARYNTEALRGALNRTAETILQQGGDNETVHGGITDGSGPERDRGLWPER